jgi:hypothetical protein
VIEVDAERRRLSLSLKRVEDGAPVRSVEAPAAQLDLSEDVFPESAAPSAEPASVDAPEPELEPEPEPAPAPTVADDPLQADLAAPDQPGPGDSEADYPASPTEEDEEQQR